MKILYLELEAFGPFLNKQIIDFEKLNDEGMFLINGPTGSGKTSLFDAIMFALFDRCSGNERDPGSLRSDLADESTKTYVKLRFASNGQIYEVYKSLGYKRKALKGSGFVEEKPGWELTLPDKTVITRKETIVEKIEKEILFLNGEQFKNVGLLAQGEFTKLVTASSKDRAIILEHLFQKEAYKYFEEKIADRFKAANAEKSNIEASINTLIENVEDKESIVGYREALADSSNLPSFIENIGKLLKVYEEEKNSTTKEYDDSLSKYNDATNRLQNLRSINKQINTYKTALSSYETLVKQKEYYDLRRILLEKQKEINLVKPYISNISRFNENIQNDEKKVKDFEHKLNEKNETKKSLSDKAKDIELKKAEFSNLEKEINNLKKVNDSLKDLKEKEKEIESESAIQNQKINQFNKISEEALLIEKRYFASTAFNLAKNLKEGVKCPVCGSIHHPETAKASNPVSEDEYKKSQEKLDKSREEVNKIIQYVKSLETKYETQQQIVFELFTTNGFAEATIEEMNKVDLPSLLNFKKEKMNEINKEIKQYESDVNSCEREISSILASIKSYKEGIENTKRNLASTTENLEEIYKNNKYVHSNSDYEALVNPADLSQKVNVDVHVLEKELNDYEKDLTKNKTIIDNADSEIKNKEVSSEEELALEVRNLDENTNDKKQKETILINKINNLKNSSKQLQDKYAECKKIIEKVSSLSELYNVARGNNRLKTTFKTYILADYFSRIVEQANRRLKVITNGRYTLQRKDEASGGNGQKGLELEVFDLESGKCRMASTLSGGEKFVTALSLALGLSDMIESTKALVEIQSIFIDEGFGTLDEQYLDTAMKALETLKSANKTIAIISHVEKLKEYIPAGIEVVKETTGSTVKIKDIY